MNRLLKDLENEDGYQKVFDQCLRLPKGAGFSIGFAVPKPDIVEGIHSSAYHSFPIHERLKSAPLVMGQGVTLSISLAYFTRKCTSTMTGMKSAEMQTAYAAANLVHGINEALGFIGDPDAPEHAVVASFATNGHRIGFYTNFSAPPEKIERLEYHQHRPACTVLVDSVKNFDRDRRQLRNL
jgi:hypothetical protein